MPTNYAPAITNNKHSYIDYKGKSIHMHFLKKMFLFRRYDYNYFYHTQLILFITGAGDQSRPSEVIDLCESPQKPDLTCKCKVYFCKNNLSILVVRKI